MLALEVQVGENVKSVAQRAWEIHKATGKTITFCHNDARFIIIDDSKSKEDYEWLPLTEQQRIVREYMEKQR